MKGSNGILLTCYLALIAWQGHAQEGHLSQIEIRELIEEVFPNQESDVPYEELYNNYLSILENPYAINKVSRKDLNQLAFLSEQQIHNFLRYRKYYSPIRSKNELLLIKGFDQSTAQKLLLFTQVSPDFDPSSTSYSRTRHSLILRYEDFLETKKGYTSPDTARDGQLTQRYLGISPKLMFKFRSRQNDKFSFGLVAEKDAGEAIRWDKGQKQYGMDYYAGHIMLENLAGIDQIVLGDYSLKSGQGMIFGSGFSPGKGSETIFTTKKKYGGINPYHSTYESKDFSGIAASASLQNATFNVILSSSNRDARLQHGELEEGDAYFESLRTTGLHRTQSQLDTKAQVNEKNAGINVDWNIMEGKMNAGINMLYTRFNKKLEPKQSIYATGTFGGDHLLTGSVYGHYIFKNAQLFSEWAIAGQHGFGMTAGLIAALTDVIHFSALFRNYSKTFTTFHGNPFRSSVAPSNERGIYTGLSYDLSPQTSVSCYFDTYTFPHAEHNKPGATSGHDWLVNIDHRISKQVECRINVRQRNTEKYQNVAGSKIDKPVSRHKTSAYAHLEVQPTKMLSSDTRIAWNIYNEEAIEKATHGIMLYQQLSWQYNDIELTGRFTIFDAKEFENRIYAYENDLRYAFSFPFYYRRGTSIMLLSQYKITDFLLFEFKIKRSQYPFANTIGSGLEEINGNKKTACKAQMILRL